jgi:hypothetical protein
MTCSTVPRCRAPAVRVWHCCCCCCCRYILLPPAACTRTNAHLLCLLASLRGAAAPQSACTSHQVGQSKCNLKYTAV